MAISTNGTVIARLAGGLYNTVMSNATYLEVASQDPSTLANTLYARDFAKSTDLAVATTLVTNLGLSSVAGLANWVAAQLTAAGAANKGAKIVSLLNDFAGMTADATYGAQATAFNTKVDAALAASQKTGAASGVFADAGTVAVTNATFTLTSGVDSGAAFTGGAGNDTFLANNAALGTLDSIDGGAGVNTLTITDSVDIPALNITAANIQNVNVTSTAGSVGAVGSDAKIAAKQVISYDVSGLSWASGGTYTLSIGGVLKAITVPTGAGTNTTATNMAAAIEAALDEGIAAATWTSTPSGTTFTVTSNTAGVALPTISWVKQSTDTAGALTTTSATYLPSASQVANQATAAAVAASTFSVPTGATAAAISAATSAKVASVSTAATTVTGTDVTLSGGASQTITATGSVYASGTTGAVVINNSQVASTSSAGIYVASTTSGTGTGVVGGFGTSSAITANGVLVTGGSTVSITNKAATISSGSASSQNTNTTQVGSAANVSSSGSLTGTETIRNLAMAPKGDVSISTKTAFTNSSGYTDVKFGAGAAKVYTNGATTVSVTGSNAVTVTDLGTTNLVPSSGATAVAGTSKLATVNLAGLSGATTHTITSDAITTVSLSDTPTAETISIANSGTLNANSGAINFNVSNVGTSSVRVVLSDATTSTVNVGSAAAASTQYVNGSAINSGSKSYVTLTAAKATAINMNNSLSVDIGDYLATAAKVATVNGAGATGAIAATIAATPSQGTAFTGGSGNDVVTIKASSDLSANATTAAVTSVNLGAGNDQLLNGGSNSANLTFTGASFNGGDGNDTVAISLITVGNAAKFTNFETLGLDLASAGTADVSILGGVTGLTLLENSTGTVTYTGATTAQGLTLGKTTTNSGGTTSIDFGTAVSGTADAYTLTFAGTGTTSATATPTVVNPGIVKTAGIEALTLVSGGSGYTNNTIVLNDTNARTLTITGSQKATVSFDAATNAFGTASTSSTSSSGVSLIDASALTGKLALTISGAYLGTAYAGITVKGGSNDDSITLAAQTGTGRYTVDAGAGADTITTSTTAATLTGGAGNDSFVVTNTVAGSDYATAPVFTTITDFSAGDTITMGSTTAVSLKSVGTANVSTATSLTDALTKALGGGSTGITAVANSTAVYFVYGGDTYIVANDTNAGYGANDIIVKLAGVTTTDLAYGSSTGLVGAA